MFRSTSGLTASSNERALEPASAPPISPAVVHGVSPRWHRSPPRLAFFWPSGGRRTEQQRRLVSFWQRGRCARPKAGAFRAGRKERRPGLVFFGCFFAGNQQKRFKIPLAGHKMSPRRDTRHRGARGRSMARLPKWQRGSLTAGRR